MASCSLLSRVMTAASLPLLFQRVSRPTPGRVKPRASLPPVVAGDAVLVAGAILLEQRDLLGAERGRLGAAGAEDAARGRRQRRRQIGLKDPAGCPPDRKGGGCGKAVAGRRSLEGE